MKLVKMVCPGCGAQIQVDAGKKQTFCGHCGTQILIDDEVQHVQYDNAEKAGYDFEKGRQRAQAESRQVSPYPQQVQNKPTKKKTWLWVLGWIFIFPLPLTILLCRKKTWNPILKYGLVAASWLFYLIIAFSGGGSNSSSTSTSDAERTVSIETSISDDQPATSSSESASNIRGLELASTRDYEVKVGNSTSESWVNASVKDKDSFSPEDVIFVSENPEIAKIEYTKPALTTYLYYKVTGVSNGETYVYAQNKDGSVVSDKIKVIVTGGSDTTEKTAENNNSTAGTNTNSDTRTTANSSTRTTDSTKTDTSSASGSETNKRTTTSTETAKTESSEIIVPIVTESDQSSTSNDRSVPSSSTKAETTSNTQANTVTTETTNNTEPAKAAESSTASNGGNGDAFNTYDNPEQQQTSETWVLNTHTMKIHHPSCNDVKKISPENYATSSSSLEELIAQGYSTCGHCF